jgi:hypothetical protein
MSAGSILITKEITTFVKTITFISIKIFGLTVELSIANWRES